MTFQRAHHAHARQLKQKALEPHNRHCRILDFFVDILVEYSDYRHSRDKGPEGHVYCSNILNCYQRNIKCRWSGISMLYPDPFAADTPLGGIDGKSDY